MSSAQLRSQSPLSSSESIQPSPPSPDHRSDDLPLTWGDFVRAWNRQDKELKREFDRINAHLHAHDTSLSELKAELKGGMSELRAGLQQSNAIAHNSRLRNPLMPIRPIPAYRPESQEIAYPAYFLRNSKQFFELNQPSSARQMARLVSLVQFYDVENFALWTNEEGKYMEEVEEDDYGSPGGTISSQGTGNRLTAEEATRKSPEMAVKTLAHLFSLDEEIYLNFKSKSIAIASKAPTLTCNTHNRGREAIKFPPPAPCHGTQAQVSADRRHLTHAGVPYQSPGSSTERTRWVGAGISRLWLQRTQCKRRRGPASGAEVHIIDIRSSW
jgi:hypothetical protein